jgi:hypothetical protein
MDKLALRYLLSIMAAISAGLAGCDRGGDAKTDEGSIDYQPLSQVYPSADEPMVEFHCLTEDASLNQFINNALKACAEGDYDKFRLIFATSQRPPERDSFGRIWQGVQGVYVQSVHGPYPNKENQPTYYVHAMVRLRKPDSKDRTKRDAVVAIFKEGNEWRLGDAPPGAKRKILAASTQPAAASRPATQPSAEAPRLTTGGRV